MIHSIVTAKRVISEESKALGILQSQLPDDFPEVVDYILNITGRVIIVGIGKSGYIARKIASSLSSTGTPAFFIHPSEASHGDLGMITKSDVVFVLSNSGETKELSDTINYCKRFSIKMVAMTMNPDSNLAQNSDFLLTIPTISEASLLSAPTTSALMMLALGDAITISLHEAKGFTKNDFLVFHPGGKIGANLIKIKELMFVGDDLPLVKGEDLFTSIILMITEKSLGCAIVIDDNYRLLGIITDGDLRRSLNKNLTSLKALDIMTASPKSVSPEILASEALFIMNKRSITMLPVTKDDKIVGVIHIHDLIRAGVT